MEKICGIYIIENIVNRHIYVGSSKDVERRMREHANCYDNPKYINTPLQRAFRKYGLDNFMYDVMVTCHEDMLLWYEQQFIDRWDPEYNISKIAGKVEMNDEIKDKISIRLKGNKNHLGIGHTVETKENMSKSKLHNKNCVGRTYSDVTIKKMSDSRKGKIASDVTKQKLSYARVGRKPNLGNKHTDETKRVISDKLKGRYVSKETREKRSKSMIGKKNALGYKHTAETRHNMSMAAKKRWEHYHGK